MAETKVNQTDTIQEAGESKVSVIVRALEKDILKGVYEKGTLMPSQNDLCSKYDVSSRTVREAFKILEAKGLVTISQGRRAYVNTNSLDQYVDSISASMMSGDNKDNKLFADLLDTYTILEISAVKTLCRQNDRSALLRKLESHLTAMKEDLDLLSVSGNEDADDDFSRNDFSFLQSIAECSHNSILKSIYKSFSSQLKKLLTPADESIEERKQKVLQYSCLLDAVKAGDDELAVSIIVVLLKRIQRRLFARVV